MAFDETGTELARTAALGVTAPPSSPEPTW